MATRRDTRGARIRIAVATRTFLTDDDQLITIPAVCCPEEGRSIALAECATCARCQIDHEDTDVGTERFIECASSRALPPDATGAIAEDSAEPWSFADRMARTRVMHVMNGNVVAVRPEVSTAALRRLLMQREFGGVPVVDERNRPIGMITRSDLLREAEAFANGDDTSPSTARQIMTGLPLAITEEVTVGQAAAHMAFEGLHRLPVVGADGRLVGILTAIDILRWLARLDGFVVPDRTARQAVND